MVLFSLPILPLVFSVSITRRIFGTRIRIRPKKIAAAPTMMITYQKPETKLLIAIRIRVVIGSESICANSSWNCGITKPKIASTTPTINAIRILG